MKEASPRYAVTSPQTHYRRWAREIQAYSRNLAKYIDRMGTGLV